MASIFIKIKRYAFTILLFLLYNCASVSQKSAISVDDISKLLNSGKDIYIENATFKNDIDFTALHSSNPVSNGINQTRFPQSVTFKNCTFEKPVCAYSNKKGNAVIYAQFQSNLSFIDCVFKSDVSFVACTVMGPAIFTNSVFAGNAHFEEISFFQNANFDKCVFLKEASFSNAMFMQYANFMNAEFYDNTSFQNTAFYAAAQFSNTKYKKYTDFYVTDWRGNAFFNYIESSDRIFFNNARFAQNAEFIDVKFNQAEIKNACFMGDLLLERDKYSEQLIFEKNYLLKKSIKSTN